MPIQWVDDMFRAGVKDAKMGNTDQVPICFEDQSTSTWGFRESQDCQTSGTGGKDKDRFTVQLTVFPDGRKVR